MSISTTSTLANLRQSVAIAAAAADLELDATSIVTLDRDDAAQGAQSS